MDKTADLLALAAENAEHVPLTRATADWADAELEAEFARLNPEIQRRVALRVLEVDALKREVRRLEEQFGSLEGCLDEIDSILENYANGGYDAVEDFFEDVDGELLKAHQIRGGSNPAKERIQTVWDERSRRSFLGLDSNQERNP